MGKISPVSIKYNIYADIELSTAVERPDVIGAIFGQTEGLLGSDLELRELQKSGRIGRIDVNLRTRNGKSVGEIILPSSMGKSETAIVAAALETIDRVGPAEGIIKISSIKDVRESKRDFIMKRAKELLQTIMEDQPDSREMQIEVQEDVKTGEIIKFGRDRLPAGPDIEKSDDLIVVEGRADVLTLLRYGIKNVIALNGARAPRTVIELAKDKEVTLFIDGDRGGELILKNLASLSDINYVARAPSGMEVEELTQKDIQKALRSREKWEEVRPAHSRRALTSRTPSRSVRSTRTSRDSRSTSHTRDRPAPSSGRLLVKQKAALKELAEDLIGSKGASLLDKNLKVLGRVPVKEISNTLKDLDDAVFAVVMDGPTDAALIKTAESKNVRHIVATKESTVRTRVNVVTAKSL